MPAVPHSRATPPRDEACPVTLRGYYEGHTPLKRFFGPAGSTPADGRHEAGMQGLLVDLRDLDPDLRKTVKLASARANPPRWLHAWLKTVVERETGRALNPEEASTSFELRRLFTQCRESLFSKEIPTRPPLRGPVTDAASTRRRAFNLLRLSLVWVHSVRPLDPVDLAEEATRFVMPDRGSRIRGRDLERSAVSPLLRATSPGTLKKTLSSLRFWLDWARTARNDVFLANEKIERLTEKISELQLHLATAREETRVYERRAADSESRVASLSRELETEQNRRINELREAKGRLQRLFDTGLAPRLRGAREAIDGGPIAADVALDRLDRALELLEEERPWLSSD